MAGGSRDTGGLYVLVACDSSGLGNLGRGGAAEGDSGEVLIEREDAGAPLGGVDLEGAAFADEGPRVVSGALGSARAEFGADEGGYRCRNYSF